MSDTAGELAASGSVLEDQLHGVKYRSRLSLVAAFNRRLICVVDSARLASAGGDRTDVAHQFIVIYGVAERRRWRCSGVRRRCLGCVRSMSSGDIFQRGALLMLSSRRRRRRRRDVSSCSADVGKLWYL